ncbi:exonuclease domain-containing protein [Halomonas vilamensis]|uniref:Excinuclease cho n=1 Tax=Vreelandella vilamensis TaxID=531309 RepID=A0ABU1H3H1_9GAMM|nr:exonuclease domain-containing protein [Halomonas vilamensis]MDR5898307.1 exonuclease domain-containing protein [Halomonas vilamensis]
MSASTFIFIDIETTGTRATRDRIIEIAALKIIDDEIVDRWTRLINPDIRVPFNITQLTGITDTMLSDAPRFADIAHALYEWLNDAPLVAHNARFDFSFLRNELKRAGFDYRSPLLCTLRLSRRIAPQERKHNLPTLLSRYGISAIRHHRAEADVEALWSLWQTWQAQYSTAEWEALLAEERRHRSLPAHLDAELLEKLPKAPGVYLFYGHNQLPLYVGKSINLRSRVLGHFQRDHQDDKEMRLAQQVQHIEWEETAGDLGAQLREAQLVKTLMPIMNRRLRKQRGLTAWHWPEGATQPSLLDAQSMERVNHNLYGLFRSARDAKSALRHIAEEEYLCPQVLGLEKGRGRCFAHQLGKCRGACCGQETLVEHTERAKNALAQLQVSAWPWPGSIAIKEHHPKGQKIAYHVINQWRYLGTTDNEAAANALTTNTAAFDLDAYRILNRFLRDPASHALEVVMLPAPA